MLAQFFNTIVRSKLISKQIVSMLLLCFCVALNSCKEDVQTKPEKERGTVTDIDGNVYQTVKIGSQWWMAENLKVTKYRNGTAIQQSQTSVQWIATTASYCIYDNNVTAPGLLYNYYAVCDTSILAPAGWHIPSDNEWKVLEMYLGMSQEDADQTNWRGSKEGEKLKIEAPQGWIKYSTVWATNESGFTALGGGCRLFNGIWGNPGLTATGFWWASTIYGDQAYYRYLDYKNTNVFRYCGPKTYGFSIRCVKD